MSLIQNVLTLQNEVLEKMENKNQTIVSEAILGDFISIRFSELFPDSSYLKVYDILATELEESQDSSLFESLGFLEKWENWINC